MDQLPLVSLIIPCRNEERFIGRCLDSIIEGDFPHEQLELIVVDGMSTDATRQVVERYLQHFPFIRLLNNPNRVTPDAMNIGIRYSRGEFIARMDAHSEVARDYLSKCLEASRQTGADNVGGVWRILSRENTAVGQSIAIALSHPFGTGNAHYKTGATERRWVDTVPFGFYRRSVMDRIGLFNENLIRGQDMEFNVRLRRAGGRILLDPCISSSYHARSTFPVSFRHNFADGYWVTYASRFTQLPIAPRHLVPLIFVIGLASSLGLSVFRPRLRYLAPCLGMFYSFTSAYFSVRAALNYRRLAYAFLLPVAFGTRHFGVGFGSVWGLIHLVLAQFRDQAASRRASAQQSPAGEHGQ